MWDSVLVVCWLVIGTEAGLHTGGVERHHHHHHHVLAAGPQLERPLDPPLPSRPDFKVGEPACLNCVPAHHSHPQYASKHRRTDKPQPQPPPQLQAQSQQSLRLEAIKTQILSKLGLAAKPNVTLTVSRKVVQDTIERAEAVDGVEEETAPPTTRAPLEVTEPDDFYGRTREIITFAEPGDYTIGVTLTC